MRAYIQNKGMDHKQKVISGCLIKGELTEIHFQQTLKRKH